MSEPRPAGDAQHTVMSVLRASEGWLEKRGVDASKRSAELLLGGVLGVDRLQLYLDHDRPLDEQERAAMRALLVSVLRLFLCFLPLLWLGSQLGGINGLMSGALVGNLMAGVMAYLFYRQGIRKLALQD